MRRIALEALGLNQKERDVLNAIRFFSMPVRLSTLAEHAAMPHSTTAFILRKLEKRKIAERIKQDGHIRWKYRKTLDLFDEEKNDIKKPYVSVVAGVKNMSREFMKILELSPAERYYSIQGAGISPSVMKKIDKKFMIEFHLKLKQKQIIIEGVVAESVLNVLEKMPKFELESHLDRLTVVYVLPDQLISFPLDIFIYRDTVLIADYETERLVRFDDSALTQAFKSFFDIAEQFGRKIDLNKRIRQLLENK